MMKHGTSMMTRCLALVMALVLLVSNAHLGLTLKVFAGETDKIIVTEGQMVANNYNLTNAEKNLVTSGLLIGGSQEFSKPVDGDNLISVDSDNKTVAIKNYEDPVSGKTWTVKSAKLVYEGGSEPLTLTEGKAAYTYEGAAFSVEANYEVMTAVDITTQDFMLSAARYLKHGKAELDTINVNKGNLSAYQQANDALVQLANGIDLGIVGTLQFKTQAAIDSAKALGEEIADNNGKLLLTDMANTYNNKNTIKSKYLIERGWIIDNTAQATYGHINNVFSDGIFELLADPDSTLSMALQEQDMATYNTIVDIFLPMTETWLLNMASVVAFDSWPYFSDPSFFMKQNMTDEDYLKLDTLIADLGTISSYSVVDTLKAAEATVKFSMSMSDVSVKVIWNTVNDSNETAAYKQYAPEAITLPDGTAKADILARIEAEGIEAAAVALWKAEFPEFETHYEATYGTLPDELSGAVTYVITYNPVKYAVTGGAVDGQYAYGYTLELPKHAASPDTVYDYFVDGVYAAEGETVTVKGAMEITRAEGAARNNTTLLENVLKDETLTADEKAILTSTAVKAGTDAISIRFPSDSKVALNESTGVVTAQKVLSEYPGKTLYWIPTVANVTVGTEVKAYPLTEGADGYTATITENNYDAVEVVYVLNVDNLDAGALKNVPYALVSETKLQMSRMSELLKEQGSLEQVPYDIMEMLKKYATGETLVHLENLLSNAYNIDMTKLDLWHYLNAYKAKTSDADKMVYYYQMQPTMETQLAMMVDALEVIKYDESFKATCIEKLGSQATDAFAKIDNIGDKLAKVSLPKVNSAIDIEDGALLGLAEKLVNSGTKVNAHASAALTMEHKITKTPSGKVKVTVNLTHGDYKASFDLTVNMGQKLSADVFNAKYAEAFAKMNIADDVAKYYTDNASAVAAIVAASHDADATYNLVWTANAYDVVVDDVNYGQITINNTSITLPEHTEDGMIYEYVVNGEAKQQGDSVNVWESFHKGTLTITRTEFNQKAEQEKTRFEEFKEAMDNASSKNLDLVFSDEDSVLTMEMAIDADQASLMNAVVDFVKGLTSQPYNIYMNGEPLYVAGEVSLQTILNAMFKDPSFNNEGLANALRNDEPLVTGEMELYAKTAASTYARVAPAPEKKLTFHIKKSGSMDLLVKAANALDAVKPYVSFQGNNGELDVKVNLPEKIYEIYLTALFAAGEVDMSDINAVNSAIAIMFVYDYMEGIITDDAITTQTFQNTLEILDETAQGKLPNYDLTQYEEEYQMLRKIFNKWTKISTVTTSGGSDAHPEIHVEIPSKKAIDMLVSKTGASVPTGILEQIMEYKDGAKLTADMNVILVNTDSDFQALVVDVAELKAGAADLKAGVTKDKLVDLLKGKGITNGVDYTKNLPGRLAEVTGSSVVILLDDVSGNLVFNGTAILDLNGKTLTGNVKANGSLYIFNSELDNAKGGIDGTVSGDVAITAGKYTADVSAFLPSGYKQDGQIVKNVLYTIATNANGDLVFQINSDVIDENIASYENFAKTTAAEIALDVAMNAFGCGMLKANGHEIYGLTFDDYMGLLADGNTAAKAVDELLNCISLPGMAEFANDIMADMLDFGAIETALKGDGIVAKYSMTTAPWTLVIKHNTKHDCLTGGLVANQDKATTRNIVVQFVGQNKTEAASFFGFLDEIVSVAELKFVNVKDLTFSDKHFNVAGGIKGKLDADLSDYTTYMAIVMANALEGNAKTDLVNATNAGDKKAMKAAFDKFNVENLVKAMKVLERGDTFEDLAKAVGINVKINLTGKKAMLEKALMWTLAAAGRALEELDIDGTKHTLGGLDDDNDGIYEFYKTLSNRNADITKGGYGVKFTLTSAEADVKVKLFEIETCKLGDVDHDGQITPNDAAVVLMYDLAMNTRTPIPEDYHHALCADVDGDGKVTPNDAAEILKYDLHHNTVYPNTGVEYVFPAEQ